MRYLSASSAVSLTLGFFTQLCSLASVLASIIMAGNLPDAQSIIDNVHCQPCIRSATVSSGTMKPTAWQKPALNIGDKSLQITYESLIYADVIWVQAGQAELPLIRFLSDLPHLSEVQQVEML